MAAPGVRVIFAPNDRFNFRAGLYTGDPADACAAGIPQVCNPNGLGFPFSDPLLLVEGAYRYNQGADELAGTFKLGGWRLFSAPEQQSVGNNALPIACRQFRGRSPIRTMGSMPSWIRCSTGFPAPEIPKASRSSAASSALRPKAT